MRNISDGEGVYIVIMWCLGIILLICGLNNTNYAIVGGVLFITSHFECFSNVISRRWRE